MILARYTILIAVLSVSVPLYAAEPVSIGAYLPMTGNVAAYGQLTWIEITTAQKMEPKVLGRPVELRLADTKSGKVDTADSDRGRRVFHHSGRYHAGRFHGP
jgi:branched-chain amino acid transport system substrate-binding protein